MDSSLHWLGVYGLWLFHDLPVSAQLSGGYLPEIRRKRCGSQHLSSKCCGWSISSHRIAHVWQLRYRMGLFSDRIYRGCYASHPISFLHFRQTHQSSECMVTGFSLSNSLSGFAHLLNIQFSLSECVGGMHRLKGLSGWRCRYLISANFFVQIPADLCQLEQKRVHPHTCFIRCTLPSQTSNRLSAYRDRQNPQALAAVC